MKESIVFNATRREVTGKHVKHLRREGKLPAVMYGKHMEPQNLLLDLKDASLLLRRVSSSTLVIINLEGKQYHALLRERQRDTLKDFYLHLDFQSVSLTETVRAMVAIVLEGESPAVHTMDAILSTGLEQVEVEALPQALPESLPVDISGLVEIGDVIHVKDLIVPDNVEVLADPEELIVVVSAPESISEEEEVEEDVFDMEVEPEVIKRGKREEDEEEE